MHFNLKGLRTGVFAVMAMLALQAGAQDLIARQAPVDKKMKAVDSVALQRLIVDEQIENPAFALYPTWDNHSIHSYPGVEVPAEYKIDLRQFCMPTTNRVITSKYGYRRRFGRMHQGLDIKVYIGDTICSAFNGKVRIVKSVRGGYGKYIVVRHTNGLETVYGHLSKHLVKEGQVVRAGEPIGLGGNTGRSTGSHLHFETLLLGKPINPSLLFDFEAQDVTGDYYVFRSRGRGELIGARTGERLSAEDLAVIEQQRAKMAEARKNPADKRPRNGAQLHKVRSGESLSTIAKKRGTTVSRLCKLNRITTKTVLRPGQILRCS